MSYQEKLELVKDFVNKQRQEQEINKKYRLELCMQISDSAELFITDGESIVITKSNIINNSISTFIKIYSIYYYQKNYLIDDFKKILLTDASITTLEAILKYIKSEEFLDMYIKENNIEVKNNV